MKIIEFEQLKSDLSKQYKVDCWIFLEDLEHSPSSTFYKTLVSFQQTAYNNNYRFILCNAKPLQPATLDHVASIINYLDISPYFVEIYTNQHQTADFFRSLTSPITVHQTQVTRTDVLCLDTIPLFNANKKMCAHAWAGLHVWTDGTAGVCCDYKGTITDPDGVPYNIKQHSIETIVSSDYMSNVRDQMRNNIDPVGCANCTKREQMGVDSRRTLSSYRLENIWGLIDWESNDVSNNLRYVGGHLGNLCNLKCRICDPSFSSTVAAEQLSQIPQDQRKQHPAYQWTENTSWAKKKNEFWDSLKQRAGQIKVFEFLGGEPLMLKQNLDFMQYLIDQGHSQDCIFDITTNGTLCPDIFKQVDQFKRLVVTVSIDNVGEKFNYERKGADWDLVVANLDQFKQIRSANSKLKIGVCVTVNIQNVFYLPELIEWIDRQQFDHYYLNLLTHPEYLSVSNLTEQARLMTLNKLSQWKFNNEARKKIQSVLCLLQEQKYSDNTTFIQEMKQKDHWRNENFSSTHKEIAKAMGYD